MVDRVRNPSKLCSVCKALMSLALVLTFSMVIATLCASAQLQSINGSVRGIVTDPTGAPVAGVTVTVKNLDTGFTRQVVTAADGVYLAANLPIGTYSVATSANGFAPFVQSGVRLDAGSDVTISQQLKLGGVATEVEVTGDAPIGRDGALRSRADDHTG